MDSLLPTSIAIVILGVIAYLIWRVRPTADALRRKRAASVGVSEEFIQAFEQRAVAIALSILDAARNRLDAEARRTGLPPAHELETAPEDSTPLAAGSQMRRAARELVLAIRNVRRLRDEAFASREFEQAEERWAYLAVVYGDRFALLADFIERMDDRSLNELGNAPPLEAARLLRSELDSRLRTYSEIEETLEAQPSTVWSLLCIVVLTMTLGEYSENEQTALAARANPRDSDSWVALMNAQLRAALRLTQSFPPCDRVRHQGVLAPPLENLELGAALVQYCANEATAQGELDQARVLVMGDSSMLWLAHDVVRVCAYPEQAVPAYATLAPLARRALQAAPEEASGALDALAQAAEQQLDATNTRRVLETVDELRAGKTPEQLRGGVDASASEAE